MKHVSEVVEKVVSDIDELVAKRGGLYGHPYDNFAVIAELWSTFLRARLRLVSGADLDLSREDVGHMMILLKVARALNQAKDADTIDDIAGYAKCIKLIREVEENPNGRAIDELLK